MNKTSLFDQTNTYPVFSSNELQEKMISTIEPYLFEKAIPFTLTAQDGNPITGTKYIITPSKGSILISHGFTESQSKYKELIYYFLKEGYNVCIHDHRNHGHSKTKVGGPTHVEHFQDYIDDFDQVVKTQLKALPRPYYLFCHSMGGLIGSTYVTKHYDIFEKVVLSSPLFEVNRGGLPYWLAKGVAKTICLFGKNTMPLPGQGTFSKEENFEGSAATNYQRYKVYFDQQLQDEYLQNGGPSCGWTYEVFKACEKIRKDCVNIRVPVLLFQADKDDFVLPHAQEQFIQTIKNGKIIFVQDSKHEIYLSDDKTLSLYFAQILEFLK